MATGAKWYVGANTSYMINQRMRNPNVLHPTVGQIFSFFFLSFARVLIDDLVMWMVRMVLHERAEGLQRCVVL